MAVIYGATITGESEVYGVPWETWQSWSQFTRDKYLVDYYRQTAPFEVATLYQYTDPPLAHDVILAYQQGQEGVDWLRNEGFSVVSDYAEEKVHDALAFGALLALVYVATR